MEKVLSDFEAKLKKELVIMQRQVLAEHGINAHLSSNIKMQAVYEKINKVARTDANVLIIGETGVGKELIAKMLHFGSPRRTEKLAVINCAAIPEHLLESELFGYCKGAFTGAYHDKPGKFEAAHNGTIFLDEISSVPLNIQTKLLRVLQEKSIERIGAHEEININVRVISATNENLKDMIGDKKFRADLYYRISTFPLEIPPLRERAEDIPLLTDFFLNKFKTDFSQNIDGISSDAREALALYEWPGNVRELENVIERAVILEENNQLTLENLPPEIIHNYVAQKEYAIDSNCTLKDGRNAVVERFEKEYLEKLFEKFDGNLKKIAIQAGVSLRSIQMKIKKYGIKTSKSHRSSKHI